MKYLAFDLETLSLRENAHILSIGAVLFDPTTMTFGDEYYVEIDPSLEQPNAHISPSTVTWWLTQPSGVFPNGDKTSIRDAIIQFDAFIRENLSSGERVAIYQQGSKDATWLENAYSGIDMKVPWNYRDVFCARTLWAHVEVPEDFVEYVGTAHNALDDAKFVAHRMMNILG